MDKKDYICPDCSGDGKETCHNPDHGFIRAMSFNDIGRLGCPLCGYDEDHKIPSGGKCETCNGIGNVTIEVAEKFILDMDEDFEPEYAIEVGE